MNWLFIDMNWLFILLLTPVVTGPAAWLARNTRLCVIIQLLGAALTLAAGLIVSYRVFTTDVITAFDEFIYLDALGAFNIALVVFIGFTAAVYSVGYMSHELERGFISKGQFHRYFLLFHFFIFSMIAVSVVNNIGLMWVGIELTTIISALLVAFYQKEGTLEAAWKYLIMGSVGISLALLGIIFIYLSRAHLLIESPAVLHWTALMQMAPELKPGWVLTAFIFVLVGYGAKAGLAPMHFWLPDAHSQAPSPVSAVLSGVLLNTALYGILRIYAIANQTVGVQASEYLIFFGIFSIGLPIAFILVQHDLKRMLAYSSVEHMGIITLGVGIGGPLGLYGAILHMFNHSMTKTLLFMAAGNINQKYHSKQMERISGVIKTMPVTGIIFLIAVFAILGMPPFSVFVSEFTIMMAGFKEGYIGVTVLFLVLIAFIFVGMAHYVIRMSFGQPPPHMPVGEISRLSTVALFLPLLLVVIGGLYVAPFLSEVIYKVSAILQGVVNYQK